MKPWLDDMIAANGRPVRENFAAWFKASKVVDADGCPLVVFHGTVSDIEEFDLRASSQFSAVQELGVWFASTSRAANRFARDAENGEPEGANVIPAFLAMEHPKVIDGGWGGLAEVAWGKHYSDRMIREWKRQLVADGHDGIELRNSRTDRGGLRTDYVAFAPNQIKSAVGNSGLYLRSADSLTDRKATVALRQAMMANNAINATVKTPRAKKRVMT